MSRTSFKPATVGEWRAQLAFFAAVRDQGRDTRISIMELIETGHVSELVKRAGAR